MSKARSCITINHNITARLKVCPYRSNTLGKKLYIHMMVTGHNTSATTCTAQLPCLQCLKCCFSLPGSPQNLPQRSFFTPRVVFALPFQIISNNAMIANTGQYPSFLSDLPVILSFVVAEEYGGGKYILTEGG